MNRNIYGWLLAAAGIFLFAIPACREFSNTAQGISGEVKKTSTANGGVLADARRPVTSATSQPGILQRNASEIIIGSFNIETFGPTKIGKAGVMAKLVRIARSFDVLGIQEVRSKNDQTILDQFVGMINANGSQYDYVISVILGSDGYHEQYAFVYDTSRIELLDAGGVIPDPNNLIFREPMFSQFRTRTADPNKAFTFTVANVHIAPDRTRTELTTLYNMMLWLRSYAMQTSNEDDVILLGDFNEPPRRYRDLWLIEELAAVLPDGVYTNTAMSSEYDNILVDQRATQEYTGEAGVIDLESTFGITYEEAKQISDHMPVWAKFTASEARNVQQFANQPSATQGR